jgi:hypothetical protein
LLYASFASSIFCSAQESVSLTSSTFSFVDSIHQIIPSFNFKAQLFVSAYFCSNSSFDGRFVVISSNHNFKSLICAVSSGNQKVFPILSANSGALKTLRVNNVPLNINHQKIFVNNAHIYST